MKSITASALALASLVPGVRANVFADEEGDAPDYAAMCAEKEGEYTEKNTKDNVGFALCQFADGTACLAEKLGYTGVACAVGKRKPDFEDYCEAMPGAKFVLKEGEVGATVFGYLVCEVAMPDGADVTITEFGYYWDADDGGEDGDAVVVSGETNPAWRLALDEIYWSLFGGTWMTVPDVFAEFPNDGEGEESIYAPAFGSNVLTVKMPAVVEEGEEFVIYVSDDYGATKALKVIAPVGGLAEGQFIILPGFVLPQLRPFIPPNLPGFMGFNLPGFMGFNLPGFMGSGFYGPGHYYPHGRGYYGGGGSGGGDHNGGGGGGDSGSGSLDTKSQKMSSGSKATERSASASAKSGSLFAKSGKRL